MKARPFENFTDVDDVKSLTRMVFSPGITMNAQKHVMKE